MTRTTVLLVAAMLASVAPGGGDDPVGGSDVEVVFDVLVTDAASATRRAGGATLRLRPGARSERLFLTEEAGEASGAEACGSGSVTVATGPSPARSAAVTWSVAAGVRSPAPEGTSLDVAWRREGAGRDRSRAVVLREDEHVLLDFVDEDPNARRCPRSVALELRARRAPLPGSEDRLLQYEVWLVHDGSSPGHSGAAHSISRQGAPVAFTFPAESIAVESGAALTKVTIGGELRGWLRPDGAIDVEITARRDVSRSDGKEAFSEAGHKSATLGSGEPVRLSLPDAGSERSLASLAGHRFGLVIVARPAP